MKKWLNGILVEMTKEEIIELEQEQQKQEAYELHRQYSQSEVLDILIKQQVNTLSIDDKTSLKMKSYYPTFEEVIGEEVKRGFKFVYENDLYKVVSPELTFQKQYPPSIHTASMYEVINEEHLGNKYDPIPFPDDGNMVLEKDKYYIQDGVMYHCHTGSVNPPYNRLEYLNGFVEVVN